MKNVLLNRVGSVRMGAKTWIGRCAVVGFAFVLMGCEQARETFGYTKQSPDEFTVVRQAPLTLPPDFNLRVPEPGRERPQQGTTTDQAYAVLTGTRARPTGRATVDVSGGSRGEGAFLRAAGAQYANPNIREVVERETTAFINEDKTLVDEIIFWRQPRDNSVQIDPAAEARRIQDNQALGQQVTEGETPTIERRRRGLLEDIF